MNFFNLKLLIWNRKCEKTTLLTSLYQIFVTRLAMFFTPYGKSTS